MPFNATPAAGTLARSRMRNGNSIIRTTLNTVYLGFFGETATSIRRKRLRYSSICGARQAWLNAAAWGLAITNSERRCSPTLAEAAIIRKSILSPVVPQRILILRFAGWHILRRTELRGSWLRSRMRIAFKEPSTMSLLTTCS